MSSNLVFRFSANSYPLSWGIRKATWSPYSHVDLVVDKDRYFGALLMGGVCHHSHHYEVEDYFELVLPVAGEEAFQLQLDIRRWILAQDGKKYDFSGIFGFAAHRDWQEPDSWFCSEIMAAGINKYYKIFNEEAHRISPRDLAIHGVLKRLTKKEVDLRFPEYQYPSIAT